MSAPRPDQKGGSGPGPSSQPAPSDLSTACMNCGSPMRPEHAHYRCPRCGWRDSCCDPPY